MRKSVAKNGHVESGQKLLSQVRAGFVARGTSLNAWCKSHQVLHQNARKCLLGEWDGPKAKALRRQIIAAAGLHKEAA